MDLRVCAKQIIGQSFSALEEVDAFRMHVLEIPSNGSNACKSVEILMGNISKTNKVICEMFDLGFEPWPNV